MSDEWPSISGSTWPSIWLRPSPDSYKKSSHTLSKVLWMRQMQHYSRVQAIYTELLCASSRFRAVREKEQQRPPNGLVKVVCLPFDGAAAQKHGRKKATDARFETMIGRSSWVDSLFVWFPAAWMPLVIDALREKNYMYTQSVSQLGAVAFTDRSQVELPEAQEFSYRVKRWQADQKWLLPCPTITHQSGLAHI